MDSANPLFNTYFSYLICRTHDSKSMAPRWNGHDVIMCILMSPFTSLSRPCFKTRYFFSCDRNILFLTQRIHREMAMPGLMNPFEWHDETEALHMLMNGVRFAPGIVRQASDVAR